ncbi:hypothetical protein GQ54DRAFT_297474 [Martensiomyces pterosporus]|nr:hypothetical protein GQ54DRAFT_297474 [Martensiomyces pterosporus]
MSTTASSKYANLPDIDTEQPDVYETPDVPQTDEVGNEEPEMPLSEDISVDKLTVDKAAARFRVAAGDVDGKSAMARYQRSLFRTLQLESLSGDLEVASGAGGAQLKETPEQRLRRLVYETQELKNQLAEESRPNDEKQGVALMKLVNGLQGELSQLSVQSEKEAAAGTGGSMVSRALWQRLDSSAQTSDSSEGKQPKSTAHVATDDVSLLEKRIDLLEKTLGTSSAQPAKDASVGHNLVDAVSRLRRQMDVLTDPHRVDGIQRRIKQVLVDLERLDLANSQASKSVLESADGKGENGVRLDPAAIKRIDELYEKFANIDSLIELAPATARRLQSLAKLHAEASEAVARIDRIEKDQGHIGEELATMKEIATSLTSAIGENSSTLKENMKFLDSRISALGDRISALQQ